MFIIENETIGLRRYTHADDRDMYYCWRDIDTQKGYNGIFSETFEEFSAHDIEAFRFWVVAVDRRTGENVGVLRLGPDAVCPDLAVWIYPGCRNKGYGTMAFRLALEYIFGTYGYDEISAGCYRDNEYSLRMLKSLGFTRYPDGDEAEVDCFTGEMTVQLEFRLRKADLPC